MKHGPKHQPKHRLIHRGVLGMALSAGLLSGLGIALAPTQAEAFCGFYVAGADASLYNDATMVVMMRDGTRTVLAMQNDYQGPPEDFALVVPVPVVLQEGDVKTLSPELFAHIDQLAAPRLVEYWEQDPCDRPYEDARKSGIVYNMEPPNAPAPGSGVTVEAQFEVGEYEVVILSAKDATGLETWLHDNHYNIPDGAEPLLQPYIESGMKFFVAKVDIDKVKFVDSPNGPRAQLSPLRFGYDSESFSLPIRLGLINAHGPQDLLIHILAPTQRYRAANYPNVTIPTNLVVEDHVRDHFGEFYVSLFDHTLAETPGAVVTEYAWSAGNCDPCPTPTLNFDELVALGADEMPSFAQFFDEDGELRSKERTLRWQLADKFTLTRLHTRYDAENLGEDLVFEATPELLGGRGMPRNGLLDPELTETGDGDGYSAFQARYAILHSWDQKLSCDDPDWDQWGGRPGAPWPPTPTVARDLAFAPRDGSLASFVGSAAHATLALAEEVEDDAAVQKQNRTKFENLAKAGESKTKGCSCSTEGSGELWELQGLLGLGLLGLGLSTRRLRTQNPSGAPSETPNETPTRSSRRARFVPSAIVATQNHRHDQPS